ncbi:Protein CBG25862 [Caenorhabditis briggsae]|uniref:Protein CBG25862 n=1 Tax=Caenorhabditis briggsae TaxID=6238 RepID=B6IIT9_CAEBR|nr:Protein CBG25862 [Caenorhabditis briggsae]CAR99819.1 Protein CBG25862 [Caenorhabditis briggsae]
MRLVDYFT